MPRHDLDVEGRVVGKAVTTNGTARTDATLQAVAAAIRLRRSIKCCPGSWHPIQAEFPRAYSCHLRLIRPGRPDHNIVLLDWNFDKESCGGITRSTGKRWKWRTCGTARCAQ